MPVVEKKIGQRCRISAPQSYTILSISHEAVGVADVRQRRVWRADREIDELLLVELCHATAAGVEERVLAKQTGHRSMLVLTRYFCEGSLFRENAAGEVGL